MKKIRFLFLLLSSLFLMYYLIQPEFTPKPVRVPNIINENREFKDQREAYFEILHAAAPGDDWRKIEETNHRERLDKIQNNSVNKNSNNEIIVPGVLQGQWNELGSDNQAGRILTIDVDYQDSIIYAASEGGNIWTGSLSGQNWNSINDYFKIDHIRLLKKIEMDSSSRLLAVDSKPYVYFTDDMGVNWQEATGLDGPQQWGSIYKAVQKQDTTVRIYLLCSEWDYTNWNSIGSIYRSDDQGESFTRLYSSPQDLGTMDLATGSDSECPVIFLNQDSVFFLSGDTSMQFRSVIPFQQGSTIDHAYLFAHTDSANLFVYAGLNVSNTTYFYLSTDSCLTWTYKGSVDENAFSSNSYCCSLSDTNKLFFGGVNAYRSYDQGTSWQMVNSWGAYYSQPESKLHADIPEIVSFMRPNGSEEYFVSSDGGLYRSTDHLQSVENLSLEGLRVSQYYSIYSHRSQTSLIFAGAQDQGFQRSVNGNTGLIKDFDQLISGDYGHLVSGNNGDGIWAVYPSFVIYFTNISQTSNPVDMEFYDFVGSNYLWMPPLMPDPYNPNQVWLAGGGSQGGAHLWQISYGSGGLSGTEMNFDFSENDPQIKISAMAYSPLKPSVRYLCTYPGFFWYSVDDGQNWTKNMSFDPPSSHYFYGNTIVASPVDSFTVYIGGSAYSNPGVYKSTDNGQSFTAMNTGLPSTMVYEMAVNEDASLLFAATESGPYVWIESEQSWFSLAGTSAPDQVYWSVDYVEAIHTVRFGTYGRGIWEFVIDDIPTSVNLLPIHEKIKAFPNPTRSSVQFSGIDQDKTCFLKIYNLSGRLVYQKSSIAGEQILWNLKNNKGEIVRSGVYFYSLIQKNETFSGKIIVE